MSTPHQHRRAHDNLAGLLFVALTGVQTVMPQPPTTVPIGKAPASDAAAARTTWSERC
jgi:hypothetical protein